MARIAVLGTGMAGFGAWHRLRLEGHEVVLYDKNPYIGGHTNSYTFEPGFTFDEGPHVSFTSDERVRALLADAVEGAYEELRYELNNYWRGHWVAHPAQTNLHGLPTELVTKVISDFVAQANEPEPRIDTYEDWLVASYGRTFADEFPERYTRKYHTTPSRNMTTDWIGPRMYRPSLEEVVRGALEPSTPNVHYITGFRYPRDGGFVRYLAKWASEAPIALEHEVVGIDTSVRELRFRNGVVASYDHLISSVPLPDLVPLLQDVPDDVLSASEALACSTCVLVNLGVGREDVSDVHISYVYDEDMCFSRLSFPHLMAPGNAPPGTSSIQAEIYFSAKYRPLERDPSTYIETTIDDLARCGILTPDDELLYKGAMRLPYANVIYDHDRAPALESIHGYLADVGIAWCGRYGDWGHIWTDEAFTSGERAAEAILAAAASRPSSLPVA